MRRSNTPLGDDSQVAGKIVVENLPRRLIATSDVHSWMRKYGNISEIVVYKEHILVQFDSDLEAAGAVQCEDGASFFGSVVKVKHVEPALLNAIRRSGPPLDRYTGGNRRYPTSGRDRDRDRDRERDRDRDRDSDRDRVRDRDRGRTRDRDTPTRNRYHDGGSPHDRRRRREDVSPRKRSRSPANPRSDRRHVHPLNWLSEVAGAQTNIAVNGSEPDPSRGTAAAPSSRTPPPYTVAIVAVQHDLVPYAETIEKRVSTELRIHDARESIPRTHIVVLLSADHLTPCLTDLTKDRVPFAIICTTTNWTHGSCTLRILYAPTQQEHRNMPLDDALVLLKKEYDAYMSKEYPSTVVSVAAPSPIVNTDDHTFLAPNRNLVTLLRMLADSRILSIGELDEIAAFVQERKRRLEGRRLEGSTADTGSGGNTTDLKSRILNMLYPPNSANTAQMNTMTGMGTFQPIHPEPMMPVQPPLNPVNLQTQNKLGAPLSNPVVQQALDTLMMMPTDRFTQPLITQQHPQHPGADVMGRPSVFSQATANPTASRPSFNVDTSKYNQQLKNFGSVRSDRPAPQNERARLLPGQKRFDAIQDNEAGQGAMQQRYSTYKQPYNDGPKAQPAGTSQKDSNMKLKASADSTSRGGTNASRLEEAGMYESQSGLGKPDMQDEEMNAPAWRGRKRGKRIQASKSTRSDSQRQSYASPDGSKGYSQTQRSAQPVDLMASDIRPVGTLADAYRHDLYGYASYASSGRAPPLLTAPHAPSGYYMSQPSGYPYPGQSYY